MSRTALRVFFERMVVAALPLAAAGCQRQCEAPPPTVWAVPNTLADDGGTRVFLPDGGAISQDDCSALCSTGFSGLVECRASTDPLGQPLVVCTKHAQPCTGRRPATLRDQGGATGFAQLALLEDASVYAFRALEAELRAHGAPAALVAGARRAAADEVRHARMMGALARRAGQTVPRAEVAPQAVRDLPEMAVENAVEGCVRETFGALVATWEGRTAADPVVRRAMAAIAVDETRHAELAWAVDRWIQPRLSPAARAEVRRARDAAIAVLLDETRGDARLHGWVAAAARDLWA